jgi:hypothetical protein
VSKGEISEEVSVTTPDTAFFSVDERHSVGGFYVDIIGLGLPIFLHGEFRDYRFFVTQDGKIVAAGPQWGIFLIDRKKKEISKSRMWYDVISEDHARLAFIGKGHPHSNSTPEQTFVDMASGILYYLAADTGIESAVLLASEAMVRIKLA